MRALLLVDLQNDFLAGGALAVAGGDEVVAEANRLMREFGLVVASGDWHPPGHCSFASRYPGRSVGECVLLGERQQVLWPDHCVQGTRGAALAEGLETARIDAVVHKGTAREVDCYSAFFDDARRETGLVELLRGRGADELHVAGLATDYCVRATVLDALGAGFAVVVHRRGIRGVELVAGDCERALEEMQAAGAVLV